MVDNGEKGLLLGGKKKASVRREEVSGVACCKFNTEQQKIICRKRVTEMSWKECESMQRVERYDQ